MLTDDKLKNALALCEQTYLSPVIARCLYHRELGQLRPISDELYAYLETVTPEFVAELIHLVRAYDKELGNAE